MKKLLLSLAAASMAVGANAQVVDSFTDEYGERTVPAADIPASTRLQTKQGTGTGIDYKFCKVGSKTYEEGGDYVYYFKMDASVKGYILNEQRPANGLVLNKISADFKQGNLRVFGMPDSLSTKFVYSGYSDNPVGNYLGTISATNPVLNVYGSYQAFILECDLENTSSAVFRTISFEWGQPQTAPDIEEPGEAELEIANMRVLGGPYNSKNSDAFLTMEFDLIYRGEGAKTVKLHPDVIQGVAHHDFFTQDVEFEGPGTQSVYYRNTLVGSIPCELGVDATLKITGDNQVLYNQPIAIANYSPKLTATSSYDGMTGVAITEVIIPMSLTCTAGPYRGTIECLIYPDETCASNTSIASSSQLIEIAGNHTDFLAFEFPELTLVPDHTYGFSFWRTKANGSTTKIGTNHKFSTTDSGVDDIAVDGNVDAQARLFNLQGVQVDRTNAAPGIYISRQGNRTVKTVIR